MVADLTTPYLPQLEWCLPDRRLTIPDNLELSKAAKRLVDATAQYPNLVMEFEDAAREVFDSCSCAAIIIVCLFAHRV